MKTCNNCKYWMPLSENSHQLITTDIGLNLEVQRGICHCERANLMRGHYPKDSGYADAIMKATEDYFGAVDGKFVRPYLNDFIFWTDEYYSCNLFEL